jgi:PAS domain S-box-containing protein
MISLEQLRRSGLDFTSPTSEPERMPSPRDAANWACHLQGYGEMGARIRGFDWSKTPLGPIEDWPVSLREAMSLCLRSRFQLGIYWGPQLVLLYNDAEREVLGTMHPRVLGMPAVEILTDMWDVVGPMLHGVLAGGAATWSVDQALRLNRHGFVEEAYFTYSYSPIADGNGVGGVLLVSFETTDRVLAERRLRALRELAAETAKAQNDDEVCTRAARVLAGYENDVPFSLLYITDRAGRFSLCASSGVGAAVDPDLWPLEEAVSSQQVKRVEDLPSGSRDSPAARLAFVLPIAQAGQAAVGCLVAGVSDLQRVDEAYRGFFNLIAAQLAAAVAGARALAEERRRAAALAEFDAAKTRLFANVSHEFRTPLALLLGPLEEMLACEEIPRSPEDLRVAAHLELAHVRREASRRESELRAQVREAQDHATGILETITDGFIALDSEWRFTYVNAAAERINGMRREDHIGKSHWELFPATRGTVIEREWRRANAERVAVEFENYYEPRDSWFHVRAYPSKDGGLSIFFHDITPRKRSEDALKRAHSELEHRVRERTLELYRSHARLGRQIAKRMRVEAERKELLRRLVGAQEDEHRRIARELHDDLTQRLAVLAIDAGTIEQIPGCPGDIKDKARGMREQLVALSESVHSLSHQMHPAILDDLGLVDTLRSECLSLNQRDGVVVNLLARDVPADLPREVALCIYRVAQESLRNVIRHARSASASVRLTGSSRELVLCVRDRGVGFDVAARRARGIGLESMRERAGLIRARLAVRSRPGEGTKVILRVPLQWRQP